MNITVTLALSPTAQQLLEALVAAINGATRTPDTLAAARLAALEYELRDLRNSVARLEWKAKAAQEAAVAAQHDADATAIAPVPREMAPAAQPQPESAHRPADVPAPSRRASATAWLTTDRWIVLQRGYPAGTPVADLRAAMQALPGVALPSNDAIAKLCYNRGLRRPPRDTDAAATLPPANGDDRVSDVPEPAGRQVEIVRNTARPHTVLTGADARPVPPRPAPMPFRPVPEALRTRDGALSATAVALAGEARQTETIDPAALRHWARNNGLSPSDAEPDAALLRRVNALRQKEFLDPWRLSARQIVQPPLPDPHVGAYFEVAGA